MNSLASASSSSHPSQKPDSREGTAPKNPNSSPPAHRGGIAPTSPSTDAPISPPSQPCGEQHPQGPPSPPPGPPQPLAHPYAATAAEGHAAFYYIRKRRPGSVDLLRWIMARRPNPPKVFSLSKNPGDNGVKLLFINIYARELVKN